MPRAHPTSTVRPKPIAPLFLLMSVALVAPACDDTPPVAPGVVDREVFISTYVDLRLTAIRSADGELDDSERSQVLARHEVTEAELLAFAEAYGTDIEFMRDVWAEVERRLDEEPLVTPPNR